jgi:hypothetical protein
MSPPVPQTVVIGKKSIWVTNKIKLQWITKKIWSKVLKQGLQVLFHIVMAKFHIPENCSAYVPMILKEFCSKINGLVMKTFQGNSDIMIDFCTYIYIYTQVSVRDITLECLQITPTKFSGSTFPGNMHNYIWCPYYLPSFMKFWLVVSEKLHWQTASEVYLGKFLSSKGHNSHKI